MEKEEIINIIEREENKLPLLYKKLTYRNFSTENLETKKKSKVYNDSDYEVTIFYKNISQLI